MQCLRILQPALWTEAHSNPAIRSSILGRFRAGPQLPLELSISLKVLHQVEISLFISLREIKEQCVVF